MNKSDLMYLSMWCLRYIITVDHIYIFFDPKIMDDRQLLFTIQDLTPILRFAFLQAPSFKSKVKEAGSGFGVFFADPFQIFPGIRQHGIGHVAVNILTVGANVDLLVKGYADSFFIPKLLKFLLKKQFLKVNLMIYSGI